MERKMRGLANAQLTFLQGPILSKSDIYSMNSSSFFVRSNEYNEACSLIFNFKNTKSSNLRDPTLPKCIKLLFFFTRFQYSSLLHFASAVCVRKSSYRKT